MFHESPVEAPPSPPTAAGQSKLLGKTAQQRDNAECPREKLPGPSKKLTDELSAKGLTAKLPDNLPTKELPNIQPTESTGKNNPVII